MSILTVDKYATPVALVSGGAKRVGRAMVLQLAALGFQVAIHYFRSEDEATELVQMIEATGGKARAFQADLDGAASAEDLFHRVTADLGTPSVLVNNASIFIPETIDKFDATQLEKNFQLHVTVPLILIHLLHQVFQTQHVDLNRSRAERLVVNMLDQRVLNPTPGFTSYNASKCALAGVTKSLAIEIAPYTRVNGIAPGPTLSPPGISPQGFGAYCDSMLLQRGSSPDDIAHLLKYLIEAKSVTGQILASDGGQHLGYLTPAEAIRNNKLGLNQG